MRGYVCYSSLHTNMRNYSVSNTVVRQWFVNFLVTLPIFILVFEVPKNAPPPPYFHSFKSKNVLLRQLLMNFDISSFFGLKKATDTNFEKINLPIFG